MIAQAAPINSRATRRQSSDDAWPIRGADGKPFYERKVTTGLGCQLNKRPQVLTDAPNTGSIS